MAVTKIEFRRVITKLDDVKMEILRLRAELLPEERPTSTERKKIIQGRRQIERRRSVTLTQLRKEFGV